MGYHSPDFASVKGGYLLVVYADGTWAASKYKGRKLLKRVLGSATHPNAAKNAAILAMKEMI